MFYRKNVKNWEQVARIVVGVGMIAGGLLAFPSSIVGYLVAASGLSLGLTGLFGFCPACALVGRKLDSSNP
jgi:hypothetical protein